MNGGFDYAGSAFTTISAPGANTESLLLSGLEPDTIYNVRVQSRNANGESVFTPEVAVTTFPPIGFPGPPIPCMADGKRLCLMSDRFEVRAFWNDFRGDKQGEAGTVEGAATEKSGSFWFFKPTNTELVVKLLDGTTSTGHFWFFYGALSDVEYWMVVTDTDSGHRSTYYNKPTGICGGADLEAIPESVITAGPVEELGGEERVGRVQVVEIPAASPALRSPARATRSEAAAMTSVGERGIKSCGGDPQSLCLLDRFDVAVTWEDHRTGKTGTGTTLPALTGNQTGRFWFFNATNVELVVKMVDGRSQTGTFWFFWGALSDVIYEIKVTDTLTGEETKYTNPAGNICGGADTQTLDG